MAKKKTKSARTPARKPSKHTEPILQMSRAEREAYFEQTPDSRLLTVFEESYTSDLVNILLDMKRSTVKELFQKLVPMRKRMMLPAVVLYHYKEYLTNPLPLTISADSGEQVPNYYAILGVPRDIKQEELKEAHKLLEKAYASEVFSRQARKAGQESLREIKAAFNILKNPKKRAEVDRLLPNISYLYPRRDQFWLDAVKRLLA